MNATLPAPGWVASRGDEDLGGRRGRRGDETTAIRTLRLNLREGRMGVVVDERVKVAPVIVIAHEIDSPVAEVALRANKGCSLLVGFGAIGDPDGGGYGVRGTADSVRGPAPPSDHCFQS